MIQAERQGKGNGRKTGEICAKMEPHDIIGDPFIEMREAARTTDSKKKEEVEGSA